MGKKLIRFILLSVLLGLLAVGGCDCDKKNPLGPGDTEGFSEGQIDVEEGGEQVITYGNEQFIVQVKDKNNNSITGVQIFYVVNDSCIQIVIKDPSNRYSPKILYVEKSSLSKQFISKKVQSSNAGVTYNIDIKLDYIPTDSGQGHDFQEDQGTISDPSLMRAIVEQARIEQYHIVTIEQLRSPTFVAELLLDKFGIDAVMTVVIYCSNVHLGVTYTTISWTLRAKNIVEFSQTMESRLETLSSDWPPGQEFQTITKHGVLHFVPMEEVLNIGSIMGKVTDSNTNLPISGATVSTLPHSKTATTGGYGEYLISDITARDYTVTASKDGYNSNSVEVTVRPARPGEADTANIQLVPITTPTAAISVTTTPASGTIYIDRVPVGKGTYSGKHSLGTHTVSFGNVENYKTPESQTFDLTQSGKSITGVYTPIEPEAGKGYISVTTIPVAGKIYIDGEEKDTGSYGGNFDVGNHTVSFGFVSGYTTPSPQSFYLSKGEVKNIVGNYGGSDKPTLSVSPTSLNFGSSSTSKQFSIKNSGTGTLTWSISDNRTWISVSPTSGSTTTETDYITVTVNRSGLSSGSYSGTVSISSNGGSTSVSIIMSVSPEPQPGPLNIYSHSEDDQYGNSNGQVNSGEKIIQDLTLKNHGSGTANSVEATLSESDSYVTIEDSYCSSWGNIGAGSTKRDDDAFIWIVSSSCPNNHVITFTVSINASNGGPWADTFNVTVHKPVEPPPPPEMTLQSHSEDDQFGNSNGKVNPGEMINQVLTLKNAGGETANDVTTTLSEADPYVTMNDSSESWGNIGAGSTKTDTSPHTWTVLSSCPSGHIIAFTLRIDASNGGPWVRIYYVTVY